MSTDSDSLQELMACAKTAEDYAALDELVKELEEAKKPKTKPIPDRWLLDSLGDVAEFFNCAESTVKQWRTCPNPMPGSHGKWPIKEIVRWREAKLKASDVKAAKLQQELERGEIALEKDRIELAKTKGEIVDRVDVERWASVALIETREMVMSLPEILATSSPPDLREAVRSEADRHCRDVLTMLHRRLEDMEEVDGNQTQIKEEE